MKIKKEYVAPDAYVVDCCVEMMIATSQLGEEVEPGDDGYGGKFQSNRRRGWGGNGFWN